MKGKLRLNLKAKLNFHKRIVNPNHNLESGCKINVSLMPYDTFCSHLSLGSHKWDIGEQFRPR